ncbi:hypothetical protein B296_00027146 [Ensete ventricosum]|uniref:Uncharacterized protein n=1 Tax=Ensete ventricosum TaxID=4639 RepID=A0A426ZR79_ENSVE|nr:hypothetical protein B296_00027146 [Ensete ventricosum]
MQLDPPVQSGAGLAASALFMINTTVDETTTKTRMSESSGAVCGLIYRWLLRREEESEGGLLPSTWYGIHGYGVEYASGAVVAISCTQLRSGMKKLADQNGGSIDLIESNLEKKEMDANELRPR